MGVTAATWCRNMDTEQSWKVPEKRTDQENDTLHGTGIISVLTSLDHTWLISLASLDTETLEAMMHFTAPVLTIGHVVLQVDRYHTSGTLGRSKVISHMCHPTGF